jgi:hypothetical protein
MILGSASLVAMLAVAILIVHPPSSSGGGAAPSGFAGSTPSGSGVIDDTAIPQEPVDGDSPPAESPVVPTDGPSQAAALQGILQQAIEDRRTVVAAVQDIQACGAGQGFEADVSALNQAATDRLDAANKAGQAPVDAIDGGQEAAQTLVTALTESAAADKAFAAWGDDVSGGRCTGQASIRGRNYKNGASASARAAAAKDEFVSAWNPIAGEYGLQTVTTDDF